MRRILFLDAATCLAMGVALSAFGAPLSALFRLPSALLFGAGLALFPIAAFMGAIAMAREVPRWGAWLAIAGNAGWVLGSLGLLAFTAPSAWGYAFVIGQALVVAVLIELELAALLRAAERGAQGLQYTVSTGTPNR
jgi:hypothetical protein